MKKLTAAVLTAIMLCSLVAITTPSTANAEPFTPLAGDVYYFTDNPYYLTYASYLVNETNYTSSQVHTINYNYYGSNPLYQEHLLYHNLNHLFADYSYNSITNSYVIFEWYDELILGDLDGDSDIDTLDLSLKNTFYNNLTSFLSTLKQHGNYVMFISSTDQCRFYNDRNFLNYVDFHVDTDIYYTFVSSIIFIMEMQNNYDPIDNVNIVFGQGFIDYTYYGSDFMDSYFMSMYFAPYIVYYQNYYNYVDFEDVFTDCDLNNYDAPIHLLFEVASGTYYDPFNNVTQYYYDTNIYNNDWVFITASYGSDYETCSRLDKMYDFYTDNGLTSAIYYYNSANYPLNYLENAEPYEATPAIYHTPSVQYLMKEYLNNADLENKYNTCSGQCDITYKMQDEGEDGWMISVVKNCWQNGPVHIEII